MTSPWEDRRALFQKGKEVHEPGRRLSSSSGSGMVEAVRRSSTSSTGGASLLDKRLSNEPASPSSPTSQRRRSSAASNGLFSKLEQHKRGSEDYATRRQSHNDQMASGNGLLSGWWSSTFLGIKKPADATDQKRGVME